MDILKSCNLIIQYTLILVVLLICSIQVKMLQTFNYHNHINYFIYLKYGFEYSILLYQ